MPHLPVLLNEVIKFLDPRPGEFFVDGTLGDGGHASATLERIEPEGTFLGIDWDEEAIKRFENKIFSSVRFKKLKIILINDNFVNLNKILKSKNLNKADGVLLDLGLSSMQLVAGRGFSFSKDEPLLMTYKKESPPLKSVLKKLGENKIFEIIKTYGEERYARRIAKAIFKHERLKPIETSGELAEVVKNAVPRNYERGRINPATRTFLAFRIYVNDELKNLENFLETIPEVLAPRARIGIISFNSLEDRLVKTKFKLLAEQNILKLITKKPIQPSVEEIGRNPRARSAKLRAALKT